MIKETRGMPQYRAKQGDCIDSIARMYGHFWETLWDHPNNEKLKNNRKNPNVLSPGDVVFVPEKRLKEESGATEQRHRFRVKGVPTRLEIRLMNGEQPRANEKYSINVDGLWQKGTTDGDGYLSIAISPETKTARLLLGDDSDEIVLSCGQLDPCSEVSGAQARLENIGIYAGEIHGKMDDATIEALRAFQRIYEIDETGELDQATQNKLIEVHKS
jgi:putative peptidoglycan binding protein